MWTHDCKQALLLAAPPTNTHTHPANQPTIQLSTSQTSAVGAVQKVWESVSEAVPPMRNDVLWSLQCKVGLVGWYVMCFWFAKKKKISREMELLMYAIVCKYPFPPFCTSSLCVFVIITHQKRSQSKHYAVSLQLCLCVCVLAFNHVWVCVFLVITNIYFY